MWAIRCTCRARCDMGHSCIGRAGCAGELLVSDAGTLDVGWVRDAYRSSESGESGQFRIESEKVTTEQVLEWLVR